MTACLRKMFLRALTYGQLEKSVAKAEELAVKTDRDYRAAVKKLEDSRRRWEKEMTFGCRVRQCLVSCAAVLC
jgi:hypothetical protein